MHLKHFWVVSRFGIPHELGHLEYASGAHLENLYIEMTQIFQNPFAVIVYVLGCGGLGYHLLHGFGSAFQTLGINHKSYTPLIKSIGVVFSIVVPFIFALIPVVMYLGIIK